MNPGKRGIRRVLGGPLAALMLCLGVAGPVLERADLAHEPVLESQHDPAACAPSHDHTLCAQAGVNLPVATRPDVLGGHRPVLAGSVRGDLRGGASSTVAPGHPTRAPPIA